jgi:hypothetical protein
MRVLLEFERFEFSEHQASPERRQTCRSPVAGMQSQLLWSFLMFERSLKDECSS